MLAAALEAEVNAHIAELADQRDDKGHRLVVRNGYHQPRSVTTLAGAVEVKAPRVNDKRVEVRTGGRKRFFSARKLCPSPDAVSAVVVWMFACVRPLITSWGLGAWSLGFRGFV